MLDPTTLTTIPDYERSIPVDSSFAYAMDPASSSRCTVFSRPIEPLEAQFCSGANPSFPMDVLPPMGRVVELNHSLPYQSFFYDDCFVQGSFITPSNASDDGRDWFDYGSNWVPVDGHSAGQVIASDDFIQGPYASHARPRSASARGCAARQRTGQACDNCRDRKAKCSGDRPVCERCASRGLICNYDANRALRLRRAARDRNRVIASSVPEQPPVFGQGPELDAYSRPRTAVYLPPGDDTSFRAMRGSSLPLAPSEPFDPSPFYTPGTNAPWPQEEPCNVPVQAPKTSNSFEELIDPMFAYTNGSFGPGENSSPVSSTSSLSTNSGFSKAVAAVLSCTPTLSSSSNSPEASSLFDYDGSSPSPKSLEIDPEGLESTEPHVLTSPTDGIFPLVEDDLVTPRTNAVYHFIDAIDSVKPEVDVLSGTQLDCRSAGGRGELVDDDRSPRHMIPSMSDESDLMVQLFGPRDLRDTESLFQA